MNALWQDLRYGARMLLKKPGFTLIAVITVALGIGANTTIFSVVAALVYPPLPAADPARVAVVSAVNTQTGMALMGASLPDLEDWRARSQSVEQFAALVWPGMLALAGGERAETVRGLYGSANLFGVLGARPLLGRTFSVDEDKPGNASVAVISHELWQRRFGGEADKLGRTLQIEGRFYSVIGVMPPGFDLFGAQLFLPLAARTGANALNRSARDALVFARLKPGAGAPQAQAELEVIARGLAESYPATNREIGVRVIGLREWYGGEYRTVGALLFGAVALLLLVACANVAGLLLARGVERQKEIAVRLALGATRWQIVRQLLTESMLLALGGGVFGVLLTMWLIEGLNVTIPAEYRWQFAVDGAALWFALAVSALTALLCGLFPAWQASRPDVHQVLKEGAVKSRRSHRLLNALIVGDVAVSLLLLVCAGLLLRSVWNFQRINLGFDPRDTVTMWLNLPEHKYRRTRDAEAFSADVLQRLQRLPGVRHAAAAHLLDLPGREETGFGFTVEGASPLIGGDDPAVLCTAVTEDYVAERSLGGRP